MKYYAGSWILWRDNVLQTPETLLKYSKKFAIQMRKAVLNA